MTTTVQHPSPPITLHITSTVSDVMSFVSLIVPELQHTIDLKYSQLLQSFINAPISNHVHFLDFLLIELDHIVKDKKKKPFHQTNPDMLAAAVSKHEYDREEEGSLFDNSDDDEYKEKQDCDDDSEQSDVDMDHDDDEDRDDHDYDGSTTNDEEYYELLHNYEKNRPTLYDRVQTCSIDLHMFKSLIIFYQQEHNLSSTADKNIVAASSTQKNIHHHDFDHYPPSTTKLPRITPPSSSTSHFNKQSIPDTVVIANTAMNFQRSHDDTSQSDDSRLSSLASGSFLNPQEQHLQKSIGSYSDVVVVDNQQQFCLGLVPPTSHQLPALMLPPAMKTNTSSAFLYPHQQLLNGSITTSTNHYLLPFPSSKNALNHGFSASSCWPPVQLLSASSRQSERNEEENEARPYTALMKEKKRLFDDDI